jgi:putative MFS transporter
MDQGIDGLRDQLDHQPLTGLHVFILIVCSLAFSFDLAEIALGGILSAIFSAPPHRIGQAELSLLLGSVYLGAIFGATVLGWLADLVGRRLVLSGRRQSFCSCALWGPIRRSRSRHGAGALWSAQ